MLERLKKNNLYSNKIFIIVAIGLIALIPAIVEFFDYDLENAMFWGAIFVIVTLLPLGYLIAACFYLVAIDKGYKDKFYLWFAFIFNVVGYMLIIALPDRGNQKNEDCDLQ